MATTTNIDSAFRAIDERQLAGDYDAILEIAQYAIDAIANDGESVCLRLQAIDTGGAGDQ